MPSRCASLTGASPVRVIAGEPGSRSPTATAVEAGCQKPLRRKQGRGPQHQVKPAASTDKQWECRADHVAAKAILDEQAPERSSRLPGVWGAARVHRGARNTGEPSASSSSRQCAPYKPKVKSGVAQRKSEGAIVLMISTTKNVEGGRGPCSGHATDGGKRKGMSSTTVTNHPVGLCAGVTNARQLQKQLWSMAKSTIKCGMILNTTRWSDARLGQKIAAVTSTQATSGRPPVSRVREIRMHGLKGGSESLRMTNVPAKGLRIYQ